MAIENLPKDWTMLDVELLINDENVLHFVVVDLEKEFISNSQICVNLKTGQAFFDIFEYREERECFLTYPKEDPIPLKLIYRNQFSRLCNS